MKIAIIGAGAMGSLFGGYLSLAGEDVWLIDVWSEQVASINAHGLKIINGDEVYLTRPQATLVPESVGVADVVLIFVKSGHTHQAAITAKRLVTTDGVIITLQNGYGNSEVLAEIVGRERVLVGTTAQAATLISPGVVRHAGTGSTFIAPLQEDSMRGNLRPIAELFTSAGLTTDFADDITALIWGKLLVNVGINALTALTGLKNGELLVHNETRELMRLAVTEGVEVAKAAGVILPYTNAIAKVEEVALATAANRSSMLQDIDHGRLTEIDVINGAIVREGVRLGLGTPVNKVLTLLVKMRESQSNR